MGDPVQYVLAKLQVPQAHTLAKGDKVLIAVVNSGIGGTHGMIVGLPSTQSGPARKCTAMVLASLAQLELSLAPGAVGQGTVGTAAAPAETR
jgi:hypothetical protein